MASMRANVTHQMWRKAVCAATLLPLLLLLGVVGTRSSDIGRSHASARASARGTAGLTRTASFSSADQLPWTPERRSSSDTSPLGDVDCSSNFDSGDETFPLQTVALPTDNLSCQSYANIIVEDAEDAADAPLVLRYSVGILSNLPPP